MMYRILQDGNEINTIVSDEAFCSEYCETNGYTYELIPDPEPVLETETEREPTAEDDLSSLLIDQEYRLTLLELGL